MNTVLETEGAEAWFLREWRNLVAVFDSACRDADWAIAADVATGLGRFFLTHPYLGTLAHHEQALAVAEAHPSALLKALAEANIGMMHRRAGSWTEAQRLLEGARDRLATLDQQRMLAIVLTELGVVLREQGLREAADEAHREALTKLPEDSVETAVNLTDRGVLARLDGRWAEARALHERALVTLTRSPDRYNEARARNHLAKALTLLGAWPQALGQFNRSIAIRRELGDLFSIGRASTNLAVLLMQMGALEQAEPLFNDALSNAELASDPVGVAAAQINHGALKWLRGRDEEATAVLEEGLVAAGNARAPRLETRATLALGAIELAQANEARARQLFDQACELALETGDRVGHGDALNSLGRLALLDGDLELADEHLAQAHSIFSQLAYPAGLAISAVHRAALAEAVRPGSGLESAESALVSATSLGAPLISAEALVVKGDSLRSLGRPAAAQSDWQQSLELLWAAGAADLYGAAARLDAAR